MKMSRSLIFAVLCIYRHSYSFIQLNVANAFTSIPSRTQSRAWQPSNSHMEERTHVEEEGSAPSNEMLLPNLYPQFGDILKESGFVTPTPIQRSSAIRARKGENLLLIAATGSGKTLAYLLPALSRVRESTKRKTVLIVAPTRELAAQLARDASILLPDEVDDDGSEINSVLLAVRGILPPNPNQIARASVLVGTPDELYAVLTRIKGAQFFIAGGTLSNIILDEVDVLLPPTPKTIRTSFDGADDARRERQTLEQRRKMRAAQRRGIEFHGGTGKPDSIDLSMGVNSLILAPTERILRLVASARYAELSSDRSELQLLAGSATASRSTLDRLNKALKMASMEGGVIGMGDMTDIVWKGYVKVCRAETSDNNSDEENASPESSTNESHTIRAVVVPSVVSHRYVRMSKESITNAHEVLAQVAKVTRQLKPETSLIFICGEFSRAITKEKQIEAPKVKGKTSQARRDAKRRRLFIEKQKENKSKNSNSGLPEPLSVRSACSILQSMEIDARPMHVALGLEPNANDSTDDTEEDVYDDEIKSPPVLVTFEGSARGLHFDGIDIVFVVGRPTSAASYLHLAGRVGRAVPKDNDSIADNSDVEVRPGTVVSFCSTGRVKELEKWTSQIGGTGLEEITVI